MFVSMPWSHRSRPNTSDPSLWCARPGIQLSSSVLQTRPTWCHSSESNHTWVRCLLLLPLHLAKVDLLNASDWGEICSGLVWTVCAIWAICTTCILRTTASLRFYTTYSILMFSWDEMYKSSSSQHSTNIGYISNVCFWIKYLNQFWFSNCKFETLQLYLKLFLLFVMFFPWPHISLKSKREDLAFLKLVLIFDQSLKNSR